VYLSRPTGLGASAGRPLAIPRWRPFVAIASCILTTFAGLLATTAPAAALTRCADVSHGELQYHRCEDTTTYTGPGGPAYTGPGVTRVPFNAADAAYHPPAASIEAKLALAESFHPYIEQRLVANATGSSSSSALNSNQGPPDYSTVNVPSYEQDTWWTCGPSATRIVLGGMTGNDFGEGQSMSWSKADGRYEGGSGLAGEENTLDPYGPQEGGTYPNPIARTLNAHQGRNPYTYYSPGGPTELLGDISTDVGDSRYRVGVVEDIATQYLPFWGGKAYGHYDVIYGYDYYSSGHVMIYDEYNAPRWESGANYQPLGAHTVTLQQDWNAEYGIVW
jgi:hypothetical protein